MIWKHRTNNILLCVFGGPPFIIRAINCSHLLILSLSSDAYPKTTKPLKLTSDSFHTEEVLVADVQVDRIILCTIILLRSGHFLYQFVRCCFVENAKNEMNFLSLSKYV